MKRLINVLLLLISLNCAFGQISLNYENYKKYWWYRQRLNNDYIVTGDCQGCSLPMAQRAGYYESSGIARWGDNTINLGNYIAVLATEYELLKRNNQPLDSTIKDLYYAIKAVNRLDNSAESIFRCSSCPITPLPGDLNGFFVRDDISYNFLNEHPDLKPGVTTTRAINQVQSDYESYKADPAALLAMSHDQIWPLYMGFSLISKFVDDNISYQGKELNDVYPSTGIKEEAKNIADRILTRIKNDDWYIRNPVDNSVPLGGYIGEISYGAAEAACFIKYENVTPNVLYPIHSCNDYHDFPITTLDASIWNNFGRGIGTLLAISDEDFKIQLIAAIGNSWWSDINPFLPDPVTILQLTFNPLNLLNPWNFVSVVVTLLPLPPVNLTAPELTTRSLIRDYQHLPLLRQVLHGGTNGVPEAQYDNLINSAPCQGPWCYAYPGNSASFEWSTSNRLHKPDERGGAGDAHFNFGEFNGIDYMLYYNLFALSQGTNGAGINYSDYVNRRVTNAFPVLGIGLAPSLAVIEGFSYIDASNIINNNAAVDFRAGKKIHLGPGFHADAGAHFHAYIDPFECSSDGNYRNVQNSDTNLNTAVAYEGQTTFVNYQKPSQNQTSTRSEPNQETTITALSLETSINPISVRENAAEIIVYPTPNNGNFTMSIPLNDREIISSLTITNIFGNVIQKLQIVGSTANINISNQPKGVYYIKIENKEGSKMIKTICQ